MIMELGDLYFVYREHQIRLKDRPDILRRLTEGKIETIPQFMAVKNWKDIFPEIKLRWIRLGMEKIQQRERSSTPSTPSVYTCNNQYLIVCR